MTFPHYLASNLYSVFGPALNSALDEELDDGRDDEGTMVPLENEPTPALN